LLGVSIRLTDYNSPELFSPKCPREHELAWKAKVELERIMLVIARLSVTGVRIKPRWRRT